MFGVAIIAEIQKSEKRKKLIQSVHFIYIGATQGILTYGQKGVFFIHDAICFN